MSATLDNNIDVNISLDSAPVSTRGFGIPLVADVSTFAERYKTYTSSASANADTDLTNYQKEAIAAMFSQSRAPSTVAAGRLTADVAQVVTFTIVNDVAQDYTITINGTDYTFDNDPVLGVNAVASGLQALVNADPAVGATVVTDTVTVTSSTAGTAFTYAIATSVTADPTDDITVVETTPNKDISDDLDAILAENGDWYELVIVSRTATNIQKAAVWTEANGRTYFAQTSLSDVKGAGSSDVASILKAASYNRTAVMFYGTDATEAAEAWVGNRAAYDMDETSTTWAYATLAGVATDTLTSTERTNLDSKNVNYYLTFGGIGATYPGKMASGQYIDLVILADWTDARITEALQQQFLNASNRGSKIPYTDPGISSVKATVAGVLQNGVTIGHYTPGTISLSFPTLAECTTADRAARIYRASFSVQPSGAIHECVINGYITLDV